MKLPRKGIWARWDFFIGKRPSLTNLGSSTVKKAFGLNLWMISTTLEAELVINYPVRRKIVTWLMIMGNAGIVTVIVTATSKRG